MTGSRRLKAVVVVAAAVLLVEGPAQLSADAADSHPRTSSSDVSAHSRAAQASRLTIATWNIGNGSYADARKVLAQSSAMALQEAGDRGRLLRALHGVGYRVLR